jgi:hypothetical protein
VTVPDSAADDEPLLSDRTAWWLTVGASLTGVGLIAVACAVAVHHACYDTPPPVSVPDAGTPRALYCDRIESWHLWPFLIGAPLLLTALLLAVCRRRKLLALIVSTVVATCVLANAIVANQLTWALTI